MLEPDQRWPVREGRPLALVAVLDLSELAGFESPVNLPSEGVLNFFFDADDQPWGFDPADANGWAVLLAEVGRASEREAPDGLDPFDLVPLEPVAVRSMPSWEESVAADLTEDELSALEDPPSDALGSTRHRVGGWPDLIQAPFWLECQLASSGIGPDRSQEARTRDVVGGASDWQLLMQIDSDEDAGFMWGDVGRLYFSIRRQDLAEQRFDRVWLTLQCC